MLATGAMLLAVPSSGAVPAAFSGTNGLIFFASDRAGRGIEGWVTRPEGGRPRRLELGARRASWSPDGRRIVFDANEEIYVVKADGTGLRRLTRNRVADVSPTWTPDGSQILFLRREGLYLMKPDGTRRRRLRRTPRCASDPAFSPDGTKIVFVDVCGESPIYVMNADGTGVRQIGVGDNPSWSPDGAQLAFDTFFRPPSIALVRGDGSAPRILTSGAEPAWSPDGEKIVFTREEPVVCSPGDRITRLLAVNVDGSGEVEVTSRSSTGRCEFRDSDPDWQPRCTRYGTKRRDRLVGTAGRDIVCALGSSDRVEAAAGDDVVIGGAGRDVIYGGPGADWLFGSAGDDLLLARDGQPDIVDGGPGRDRARVDVGLDRTRGVESMLK